MTCCANNTPRDACLEVEDIPLFTKPRIVLNIDQSLVAAEGDLAPVKDLGLKKVNAIEEAQ